MSTTISSYAARLHAAHGENHIVHMHLVKPIARRHVALITDEALRGILAGPTDAILALKERLIGITSLGCREYQNEARVHLRALSAEVSRRANCGL